MPLRIAGKLVSNTGPGLAVQEVLYGFIMAMIFVNAAQVGIIQVDSNLHLALVIFSMNFTWGLIDAMVVVLVGDLERRRSMLILSRSGGGLCPECRAMVEDDLSGTIVDAIDPEEEGEIIDRILSSRIESEDEVRKDRRALRRAGASSFAITVLSALPAIIPLLLIPNLHAALFAASAFGAAALFFVGYAMSRHVGVGKWRMASAFLLIGLAVTLLATFMGG